MWFCAYLFLPIPPPWPESESTVIFQVSYDDDYDPAGSSGDGKRWSDSGNILK